MMGLKRGDSICLANLKTLPDRLLIGLGWDKLIDKGKGLFSSKPIPIDCDAAAILVKNNKFINQEDVVYYDMLKHKSGAVELLGDNLTGEGDGDDEQIMVYLDKIPEDVEKIVIAVNIYEAVKRKHHFGMIENAFIRMVDFNSKKELFRYNLSEKYDGMTTMIFGEIHRKNEEWLFDIQGLATKDSDFLDVLKRYC